MKLNLKKYAQLSAMAMALVCSAQLFTSCADDDMSKTVADYDPRYTGTIAFGNSDYNVDAEAQEVIVKVLADRDWTASLSYDKTATDTTWASLAETSGAASSDSIQLKVNLKANESLKNSRQCTVTLTTAKGATKSFTIAQNYKVVVLEPSSIEDYAKYICPAKTNEHFEKGADYMLRQDSYYSWHRMKQSEHFFVFWSPEFGDDPNGEDVASAMRVDVDDLLEKAEKFFNTNVNYLGMAKLGQGLSMLDNYKMQIYLIYQDTWLATGSGYDDKIGALWVNPSTCKPVGSTIAHEIGHSFQYQVAADKKNCEGIEDYKNYGFRYGYNDADGAGGNAFWEQCAQWQAQLDYPSEMFGYHLDTWRGNCHRHFNHPWMRYASYWFQHVMVEKHGVDAFGRIWRESKALEDPLEAYRRIYCNDDQNALYSDLYDYASRMVNYDLIFAKSDNNGVEEATVPESAKGNYSTALYKVKSDIEGVKKYQVGYASCPGTTGFNVIELKVPNAGTKVTVDVAALAPGSSLASGDPGEQVDGDMKKTGTKVTTYTQQENTGSSFRFGYVAVVNGQYAYSDMKQGAMGAAEIEIPVGTEKLYFVILAAPTTYNHVVWKDDAASQNAADEQWPYTISVSGTDVSTYVETIEVNIPEGAQTKDGETTVLVTDEIPTDYANYQFGTINLGYLDNAAVCYAFALTPAEISAKLVASSKWTSDDELEEGKIAMRLRLPDGTTTYTDNQGGTLAGYWMNGEGALQAWGQDARTFITFSSLSELGYGVMPLNEGHVAGTVYKCSPQLVYRKNGKIYTFTFNLQFKIKG